MRFKSRQPSLLDLGENSQSAPAAPAREWTPPPDWRAITPLVAGRTEDTRATSAAAARRIEPDRDTQRARVYDAIHAAGEQGATDEELQEALGLDGSSERPRRWELWKQDRIAVKRTPAGERVTRRTRTNRPAVVWIAR